NHGLLRVTPDLKVSTEFLTNTPGVGITAVYQDRDGDIWFGGAHGVELLRDGMFIQYGTAQGLPAQEEGPIYADEDGRIWFAPVTGGLYWLKDGAIHNVTAAGLDKDVVYSISGG